MDLFARDEKTLPHSINFTALAGETDFSLVSLMTFSFIARILGFYLLPNQERVVCNDVSGQNISAVSCSERDHYEVNDNCFHVLLLSGKHTTPLGKCVPLVGWFSPDGGCFRTWLSPHPFSFLHTAEVRAFRFCKTELDT